MKRILLITLATVIALAFMTLLTTPSTHAGKLCSSDQGCPKGQFCVLGKCVKTIPCEIVLCAPCPAGYVLSPTDRDCCRCVQDKDPGDK